jgi:hypothetical protein
MANEVTAILNDAGRLFIFNLGMAWCPDSTGPWRLLELVRGQRIVLVQPGRPDSGAPLFCETFPLIPRSWVCRSSGCFARIIARARVAPATANYAVAATPPLQLTQQQAAAPGRAAGDRGSVLSRCATGIPSFWRRRGR